MKSDLDEGTIFSLSTVFVLQRARLLGLSGLYDVHVADSTIVSIRPTLSLEEPVATTPLLQIGLSEAGRRSVSSADLQGRLLIPSFVDIHTHLDKALTLSYTENPSGTLAGAIEAFAAHEDGITEEDIYERTIQTALMAVQHGTTLLRTHLNYGRNGGMFAKSVSGITAAKRVLRDVIDIQLVLMCPLEAQASVESILAEKARFLTALGGASHLSAHPRENLQWIVGLARKMDLSIDMHVDETLNPAMRNILDLVELAPTDDFALPTIAGHCVSLGAIPHAEVEEVCKRVAERKIGVVTLPGSNLFLQARQDTQDVRRGVTSIQALVRCGAQVAAASDNIQDVFHPFGRGDLLDAAQLSAYLAHFQPAEAEQALRMVSSVPGYLATGREHEIEVGNIADMVVLDCPSALSALQTLSPGRWTFKRGRLVSILQQTKQFQIENGIKLGV
ncbi:amidohydrolase family protein [Alicyclobacillus fodiniaquatilis]|uniref:Amidohydrolase family protein n=1 Tax=Alicyclobacillus fodiniaquatilis TaxID=1661150 RepID=A0ABW4JNF0_9BACL